MKSIVLLVLFIAFARPVLAKEPIRSFEGCIVVKVADGDTITANCGGTKVKARLYGIDAPETEKSNRRTGRVSKPGQPYGEEAHQALVNKLGRHRVRLDVMDIDRYRRAVSLIWVDGREVNREMVAEGWAWAYRQYLDRPYMSKYVQSEEQARQERRGLWQQDNPQPPWEFRRLMRYKK